MGSFFSMVLPPVKYHHQPYSTCRKKRESKVMWKKTFFCLLDEFKHRVKWWDRKEEKKKKDQQDIWIRSVDGSFHGDTPVAQAVKVQPSVGSCSLPIWCAILVYRGELTLKSYVLCSCGATITTTLIVMLVMLVYTEISISSPTPIHEM